MCRQSASVCLIKSPSRQHRALPGLPQRLATLADPRHRRGKRHPFVSVLLIACSAVLSGARSFAAIGQWAKNAPQEALARLGARTTSVFAVRVAPSTATVRRIINRTCPGGLADLLAVDGKSARGTPHPRGWSHVPQPDQVPGGVGPAPAGMVRTSKSRT